MYRMILIYIDFVCIAIFTPCNLLYLLWTTTKNTIQQRRLLSFIQPRAKSKKMTNFPNLCRLSQKHLLLSCPIFASNYASENPTSGCNERRVSTYNNNRFRGRNDRRLPIILKLGGNLVKFIKNFFHQLVHFKSEMQWVDTLQISGLWSIH